MAKLKPVQWVQLVFMFFAVILVLGTFGQMASPNERLTELSLATAYSCFSILYFESSATPYVAAICKQPSSFPEILRVSMQSADFSANHAVDVVGFLTVVVGGLISWARFGYTLIRKYLPWL
ncbi:hypothetical protein [uncultured Alcanivorax sp.]|jgi:hypothetical protein|uniref:hypothetical protein n=1 Tax=uncultured Alcanivorax sp. TaxID=191215 RepID=UPI0030DA4AE6